METLSLLMVLTLFSLVIGVKDNIVCNYKNIKIGILPRLDNESLYDIDLPLKKKIPLTRKFPREVFGVPLRQKTKPGQTCYKARLFRIPLSADQSGRHRITDPVTLKALRGVDIVCGEYRRSVESYAQLYRQPFILTVPPSIELERQLQDVPAEDRVVFSAWPPWYTFFEESVHSVLSHRIHNEITEGTLGYVLILVENSAEDGVQIAQELQHHLLACRCTTALRMVILNTRRMNIAKTIAKDIIDDPPNIVVYYYDTRQKMELLFQIGAEISERKQLSMSREKTEWFLWHMTSQYSGTRHYLLSKGGFALTRVLNLHEIQLFVDNPLGYECDDIKTDIVSAMGMNDAIVVSMANIALGMTSGKFSRRGLLSQLRKINRGLSMSSRTGWAMHFITPYRPESASDVYKHAVTEFAETITGEHAARITLNITKLAATHQPLNLASIKRKTRAVWTSQLTSVRSGWSFRDGFRAFASIVIGKVMPDEIRQKEVITYKGCGPHLEYFRTRYFNRTGHEVPYQSPFTKEAHASDRKKKKRRGIPIVVVLEDPFAFRTGRRGNAGYNGIVIDICRTLFERISSDEGRVFRYSFYAAPNNTYGTYNILTNTWDGAMGELMSNADMAIGMISKTKKRMRDFDFTPPFEYVGMTYITKPYKYEATLWAFMKPFHESVWIGVAVVIFLSGLFIRFLEYWNPFNHEIAPDTEFNFKESFWYSYGTVMQVGGSFAPVLHPTRVYSVFYWFFALVVAASYTGNLASFLTESNAKELKVGLAGLHQHKGIRWGTLKSSYMDTYIKTKSYTDVDYLTLVRGMEYFSSYKDGVERVKRDEKFAFIGTHLLLHYYEAKDAGCSLNLGDGLEAYTEVAFPMRRSWRMRHRVKEEMREMRRDGTIRNILQRWMRYGNCESNSDSHLELDFTNFQGLYVMLAIFLFASIVVLCVKLTLLKLKIITKRRKKKREEKKRLEDEDTSLIWVKHNGIVREVHLKRTPETQAILDRLKEAIPCVSDPGKESSV